MKHWHHIIPRHAGGTNDPSNLKEVTVAQHATEHSDLYVLYGRQEDYVAWRGLAGIISHEDAVYEQICLAAKKGGKARRGIKHSYETKHRISMNNAMKRPEVAKKVSGPNNGNYGKHWSRPQPRVVCQCGKEGGASAMKRYHLSNCKR